MLWYTNNQNKTTKYCKFVFIFRNLSHIHKTKTITKSFFILLFFLVFVVLNFLSSRANFFDSVKTPVFVKFCYGFCCAFCYDLKRLNPLIIPIIAATIATNNSKHTPTQKRNKIHSTIKIKRLLICVTSYLCCRYRPEIRR